MRYQKCLPLASLAVALFIFGAAADALGQSRQGYQPATERGTAAGQIVRKWAGYVQTVYRTPPSVWARSMEATFAQADLRNLQRSVGMETYEGMMGVMLGQNISDEKVIDRMAQASPSSMQALASLSPAEDLVYTMLSPCRILDTRNTGSKILSGTTRHIQVSGLNFGYQGGQSCDTEIPADPSAVVLNVVAVAPSADGFLSVYPYGTVRAASSLNYTRGGIIANELIAKATMGQPYDISVFAQADVDVVVDIVGYFMAPKASVPECYVESYIIKPLARSGGQIQAKCPVGYAATGGTCSWNDPYNSSLRTSEKFVIDNFDPKKPIGNSCNFSNNTDLIYTVEVQAVCCRLPGR